MKFLRLAIKNYRGVKESCVDFAESGVTVVQGQNEAGKTSLATAVTMLFNFKATSNHAEVRAIRPVHRDASPEIELTAESGPYRFTYAKTFHPRNGTTVLEVESPERGSYTADAAHLMAERILAETLDKALWDALMVRQGDVVDIPRLRGRTGLMQALDEASGGVADLGSETIYERVSQEYARHYGKNGAEKEPLISAAAVVTAAEKTLLGHESALADLEGKIEKSAVLGRRLSGLSSRIAAARLELEGMTCEAGEVAALSRQLAECRLAMQEAESARRFAARDVEERRRLTAAVDTALEEWQAVCGALEAERPLAESLRERLDAAEDDLRALEAAASEAERLAVQHRADFDYFSDGSRLEMLREREGRLAETKRAAEAAKAELAANRVDDALVESIKQADLELARQSARLEAAAPSVRVEGIADCDIGIDGEEVRLAAGEGREYSVARTMHVAVPGLLKLDIVPGTGSDEAREARTKAASRLAELLRQAGVATLQEAFAAHEKRRRAERIVSESGGLEREILGAMTRESFLAETGKLAESVAGYAERRPPSLPLPGNLQEARAARDAGESNAAAAVARRDEAALRLAALKKEYGQRAGRYNQLALRRDVGEKLCQQAREAVEAARGTASDDALESALTLADQRAAAAGEAVAGLEASLEGRNPGKVEAMVASLAGSLDSLRRQMEEGERERAALRTELEIRGEEGLYEKVQDARITVERLRRERDSLYARAEAARMLYEAMRLAREKARKAYLAPLRSKIEELGRWVFDQSFAVELDPEDLGIASRTLGGVTVPFAGLSGGTREQLSLIFRAACCIIVARREGMPLILDDALGYTDTERLPLMGAVLARAARECQILVFTCVPERFGNIGDAKVVQL